MLGGPLFQLLRRARLSDDALKLVRKCIVVISVFAWLPLLILSALDEPFVGSGDIQSLADLGNGFEVVRTMQIAPVTKGAVIQLAVMTLVPIVPLALTMMPLEQLIKTVFGLLF